MEIVKEIESLPQTQFNNPFIFATKLDYLIQKNFAISEVYDIVLLDYKIRVCDVDSIPLSKVSSSFDPKLLRRKSVRAF